MKISQHFINSLLARIDLVTLVEKRLSLRQIGANYVGLCPFHQEKSPSFTVNKIKQFFHCFGCQEHGDAIKFTMLTENTDFVRTVQNLAERYGMALEQTSYAPENPMISGVHKLLDFAAEYYHQNLLKNTDKSVAGLGYLIEQRKLDLSTIRFFKLGLADSGWTNFFDFVQARASSLGLDSSLNLIQVLENSGLFIQKNNKYYDRFRDRIMFPIKNRWGKMIGFGARAINSGQQPKYLNSPETIVFAKNKELYGFAELKGTLRNISSLIVVEGYLDYVMLWQAKIYNVVATLGTALNENHLKVMLGITSEIIFCFDGDPAGYKASVKAMEMVFKLLYEQTATAKNTFKFILLPPGQDPDSLLRNKGIKEFNSFLAAAQLLSDFFFNVLSQKYPGDSIENSNKLAQEAKKYIIKLPDNILRDLWLDKLAKFLGIDISMVQANTHNNKKTYLKNSRNQYQQLTNNHRNNKLPIMTTSTKALAMLLLQPDLIKHCDTLLDPAWLRLTLPADLELLHKTILAMQEVANDINLTSFSQADNSLLVVLKDKLAEVYLQRLDALDPDKIVRLIPKDGMELEFIGAVKQVKKKILELQIDELLQLAKYRELTPKEILQLQEMLSTR